MFDPKTYFQVRIANRYIRGHGITPRQFLTIDDECDVFGFLRAGYESFHLMEEEGVLRKVEEFIAFISLL